MRKSTGLWLAMAALSSIVLFNTSQKVTDGRQELSRINKSIQREEESLRVLQAEWSYLNRPDRLEKLTRQYLQLQPLKGRQFMKPEDLAKMKEPLPPEDAAGTADPSLLAAGEAPAADAAVDGDGLQDDTAAPDTLPADTAAAPQPEETPDADAPVSRPQEEPRTAEPKPAPVVPAPPEETPPQQPVDSADDNTSAPPKAATATEKPMQKPVQKPVQKPLAKPAVKTAPKPAAKPAEKPASPAASGGKRSFSDVIKGLETGKPPATRKESPR